MNRNCHIISYDDLHRLTSASTTAASSTPYRHTFTYTRVGNIATSTPAGEYFYAGTSYANPHAATSINGVSLAYDRSGNVTNYGSTNYAWNYRNELTRASTTNALMLYDYDHTGQRVRSYNQTSNSNRHTPNKFYNATSQEAIKHIFANGRPVATAETVGATTTTRYIHTDHLGGTNVVTGSGGAVSEVSDYYPYGALRIDDQVGSFTEQRKFTGHEYDSGVGLVYAGARHYDGARGQWLSQDPIHLAIGDTQFGQKFSLQLQNHLSDPQQLNSAWTKPNVSNSASASGLSGGMRTEGK